MVYVTSQPVHPMILEYYFQFLAGIPASHARARLTLLCAHDASPRSLTEKILERPRLIERIRAGIVDPQRAYLTVFNSTPLERKLAVLLGIPLNGVDPQPHPPRAPSRAAARCSARPGSPLPEGFEDLRTEHDVESALVELRERRPGIRRAVVKLNDSFSGEGNALFRYPEERVAGGGRRTRCAELEFSVPTETPEVYFDKFARMGGIVEEFIEAPREALALARSCGSARAARWSPSPPTTRSWAARAARCSSAAASPPTTTTACRSRRPAQRIGARARQPRRGEPLRGGLPGLPQRAGQTDWSLAALEINLRMGGTTHPYLALQFLTGGQLDPATGLFLSPSGQAKYYRATDNLQVRRATAACCPRT